MPFPIKIKLSSQIWWGLVFSLLALIILYVSLVRASLNLMTKNNKERKLRVNPIKYTMVREDAVVDCTYKLPEVSTLPNNPIYIFKRTRDYLWESFSNEPIEKAEILLLLADKKMTETIALYELNRFDLALDTSEDAINKLKYADRVILSVDGEDIKIEELRKQVLSAGYAYEEALKKINQNGKLNEKKYKKIITELEEWNEEKQKTEQNF